MKVDVLVMTYGEPPEARFFAQWGYSNRILYKLTRMVAPIPKMVVPLIGAMRGWGRTQDWRGLNYSSPLEAITEKQAAGVAKELNAQFPEIEWRVHIGYEFRDPTQAVMLERIRQLGCEELVIVPMYAAESDFTDGITKSDFEAYQSKNGRPLPEAKFVTFHPHHAELADVMTQYILTEAEKLGYSAEDRKKTGLLLGCHGTVIHPPKGVFDTGYCGTTMVYDLLKERLEPHFAAAPIGWFNHRLGGDWTQPTPDKSLKEMMDAGIERFLYFPFGFVADNAETQLEPKAVFEGAHQEYDHLLCVNDNPAFLQMLARVVHYRLDHEPPKHEPLPEHQAA